MKSKLFLIATFLMGMVQGADELPLCFTDEELYKINLERTLNTNFVNQERIFVDFYAQRTHQNILFKAILSQIWGDTNKFINELIETNHKNLYYHAVNKINKILVVHRSEISDEQTNNTIKAFKTLQNAIAIYLHDATWILTPLPTEKNGTTRGFDDKYTEPKDPSKKPQDYDEIYAQLMIHMKGDVIDALQTVQTEYPDLFDALVPSNK